MDITLAFQVDVLAHACIVSKTKQETVYRRGRYLGQNKFIYEVDSVNFERLWKLIYNYCDKSVKHSRRTSYLTYDKETDRKDVMQEVMQGIFFLLRVYGPEHGGKTFSYMFRNRVGSILKNVHNQRRRDCERFSLRQHHSLHEVRGVYEPFGTQYCLIDVVADKEQEREVKEKLFWDSIASPKDKEIIQYYFSEGISKTIAQFHIHPIVLKKLFKKVLKEQEEVCIL